MARGRLDLPAYLGSTLRGAFGHVFRALACPGRFDEPCPIPDSCPYHLIFETSPPPDSSALRNHDEIPRPFVIAPITNGAGGWLEHGRNLIEPGSELSFDLTLIGRAQEYFPYFVVALREIDRLGRRHEYPRPRFSVGEGRERVPPVDVFENQPPADPQQSEPSARDDSRRRASRLVELRRIDLRDPRSDASWPVYDAADNLVRPMRKPLTLSECAALPSPASGRLTIDFLTQTRLKHNGGWARVPEFQIVFRRLLGRLSSMARFHCGAPLEIDFKGLIEKAGEVRLIDNQTRWVSWTRYSSRQRQRMDWEGIWGRAAYEGDFAPYWKFLKFGEFVHLGHGCTFGLGKYALRAG